MCRDYTTTDLVIPEKSIKRYEVYYCDFENHIIDPTENPTDSTDGGLSNPEISKTGRPAVIISPDDHNEISNKILCLPFCSNRTNLSDEEFIKDRAKIGEKLIPIRLLRKRMSFLIVNQPRTIWKCNVRGFMGVLSKEKTPEIIKTINDFLYYLQIDPDVIPKGSVDVESEIKKRVNEIVSSETPKIEARFKTEYAEKLAKEQDKLNKELADTKKKYEDKFISLSKATKPTKPEPLDAKYDIRKMTKDEVFKYLGIKSYQDITEPTTKAKLEKKPSIKEYNEAYNMYRNGEITPKEAAEMLGVTTQTIYNNFHKLEETTEKVANINI